MAPTFIFRDTVTGELTELVGEVPFDVAGLLPDGTYQVAVGSDWAAQTLTVGSGVGTPDPVITTLGSLSDIEATVGIAPTAVDISEMFSVSSGSMTFGLSPSSQTMPSWASLSTGGVLTLSAPSAALTARAIIVRASVVGRPDIYADLGFWISAVEAGSAYVEPIITATSGTLTITSDANYTYYTASADATFQSDRACTVDIELIGGGGGSGQYSGRAGGGGGAGGRLLTNGVALSAGTPYATSIGQGGTAGSATPTVVVPGNGGATSIAALGLSVAGGGAGGFGSTTSNRYGQSGACTGGSTDNGTSTTTWGAAVASLGGLGAIGLGASSEAGAGGGMGGNAVAAAALGSLSTPGAGVTSVLGDTVCAGGGTVLFNGGLVAGVTGVHPGDGAKGGREGATPQGLNGGDGANGRVVIRVPKTFAAFNLTIAEPAVDGMGLALNAAMTSATVAFAGTDTSGTAGTMQARVLDSTDAVVTGWTDAGTSNGTTFSVSVTAPASTKKHHVEVRRADTPSVVARQTKGWRTAIIVIGDGQSNKRGEDNAETPAAVSAYTTHVKAYRSDGSATVTADYTGGTNINVATGDGQIAFANELHSLTGLPVVYVLGGKSGTPIEYLQPGSITHEDIVTAITALGLTHVHAMSWNQGEANVDDIGAGTMTPAAYAAYLQVIRRDFEDTTGQAANSMAIIQTSLASTGAVADTDAAWTATRAMQRDYLPVNVTGYHYVTNALDFVRKDDFHGPGGSYSRRQLREARYLAYLLGFASSPGTFRVASVAKTSATVTTLTVQHGMGSAMEIATRTDGVVGGTVVATVTSGALDSPAVTTKVNSFQVSGDGGATWVAVAGADVALTDGTTITLTHADVGTGGVRKVRYGYGREPNGIIRDNSTYNWPLQLEDGMAAS